MNVLYVGGPYHGSVLPEAESGYAPLDIAPPSDCERLGRWLVHVYVDLLDPDRHDDLRRYLLDAALRAAGVPERKTTWLEPLPLPDPPCLPCKGRGHLGNVLRPWPVCSACKGTGKTPIPEAQSA